MMFERCVINSSPLIIFQRTGHMDLLKDLLGRASIPAAVRREVYLSDVPPPWIEERQLTQPLASQILASRLGAGEREAIALALEMSASCLVLDDLAARRLAQSLNIAVVGSLGLLLQAKARGLVPAIRPIIEIMQSADFRVSERVFVGILVAAGEHTA